MLDSERGPSTAHDRLSGAHAPLRMTNHAGVIGREKRGQECPRPTINLLNQRASIAAVWFFFGGDDDGGGYAVAGFEVQQANALRVAAGFADGF
jgi:hypothetical protein